MELLKYKKSKDPSVAKPQKQLNLWLIGLAVVALGGGIGYWYVVRINNTTVEPEPITNYVPVAVTALGRLEPAGEVIKLSVANAQDSRVNELLVEEGDRVAAGQLIATLQGLDQKQAELTAAKQNVAVYQAKLEQVKAGEAKSAEIEAQRANIARLKAQLRNESLEREAEIADAKAELTNARVNYNRYQTLYQDGAVSRSNLDDRQELYQRSQARVDRAEARYNNTIASLEKQIDQEKAILNKLKEVRPVDLAEARTEVDYARAKVKQIESELEDYYVRVPIAGQILKINTLVGEQVDTSQGIVELGKTSQMYAIAEVYETDVGKVKVGQSATVISEHGGFEGKLQGTVDHIGLQIKKQDILESDPAADKDARVVEVKVRLVPQDSEKVAGLTNLQVRVKIDLDSGQ
ncbi:MAG: ABC exporter membrane fusion protein [Pleurocapsa sp.]